MQICSLVCRLLPLVGGTQCWKDAGNLYQVQREQYILKDWTGWLMRRFKGLKKCHWLSNEVEIEYDNFTNISLKI